MYNLSTSQLLLVVLCFSVFLATLAVLVLIGRRRRAVWNEQIRQLSTKQQGQNGGLIRQAQRARRASDSYARMLQRIYYGTLIGVPCLFLLVDQLPLDAFTRLVLWLGLCSLSLLGVIGFLTSRYNRDEDLDAILHQYLQHVQEQALSTPGVAVHDPATGLYTPEFWYFALDTPISRGTRRQPPTTCIMIELVGWKTFTQDHSVEDAGRVLSMIGTMLMKNVRVYDLVCQYDEQHFAIALCGCPKEFGERVGERVTNNLTHLILEGINQQFSSKLQVKWGYMAVPPQRTEPRRIRLAQANVQ